MKTIRQNVFETNSSSTHSVTICNKTKPNSSFEPLVENGIIYPSRLNQFVASFGDSYGLTCDDKDKKAAIVFEWIRAEKENCKFNDATALRYIEYLKNELGYSEVVFSKTCSDYSPYDEYDSPFYLEELEDEDVEGCDSDLNNIDTINSMIEVILNEDKMIVDSESAY